MHGAFIEFEKPCTQAICAHTTEKSGKYDFIRPSICSFFPSLARSLSHSPPEYSVNHYYLCIYCFAYKNEIVAIVVHLVLNITFFLLGNRIAIIHLKCFIFERTTNDEHTDDSERKKEREQHGHNSTVATARTKK